MENQEKIWRAFFAVGLIAIAVQQIVCSDLRPVIILPNYPAWLQPRLLWTWIISMALVAASIAILFDLKARQVSVILGTFLLLLVLAFQIPGQPYPKHIGSWTDAFKELTLSGGAFLVAGSIPKRANTRELFNLPSKLIPLGKYFMAITMAVFGWMHFVYSDFVTSLVPDWIPFHLFWTWLAGLALIAGGLGVILNIKRRLAAGLLGIMIFIWLLVLHLPRAIADPHSGNGNEWTSVFEALAFSGIAFLVADATRQKSAIL